MYADNYYCASCYDDLFLNCDACGDTMHSDGSHYYNDEYYCDRCYDNARHRVIKEYGYKPRPQFFRADDDGMTYGIELEVERVDSQVSPNDMAATIKHDHHYFKQDGSINDGFEIVSHPMSEKWINENKAIFSDYLSKLRTAGYRAYQTSTCGMHIHISKREFTTWHLYRFMKFFYDNPAFILLISQRKEDNLNRWAAVRDRDKPLLRKMAQSKRTYIERYSAINLTSATAEVRIFRGTLCETSFFKNIEFITSLVAFTKDNSNISVKKYLKWLLKKSDKYANLHAWLVNKNDKVTIVAGAEYVPKTIDQSIDEVSPPAFAQAC